jgi:hypothetical protein
MRFSRLLLVIAAAFPLGACMTAAEQAREIEASDDAVCRHDGFKPGAPAYAKCRDDRARLRAAQAESDAVAQRMFSALNQANQLQMQQQQTMMMMRR